MTTNISVYTEALTFGDLHPEEVFLLTGQDVLFLSLEEVDSSENGAFNAVNIITKETCYISHSQNIVLVKAKVVRV